MSDLRLQYPHGADTGMAVVNTISVLVIGGVPIAAVCGTCDVLHSDTEWPTCTRCRIEGTPDELRPQRFAEWECAGCGGKNYKNQANCMGCDEARTSEC